VGEICLRGASVFLGYWRNPEATARALDRDRWYRTGDVGVIRDGYVHLEGRRNDLIIRGGENISPVEIENRLFEHPEIAEVAVVGVEHPKLGQEVAAFVVPHTPGALTETDKPLPEGEVGEICLRGASCFLAYWRNPEATARALDDERWYRTGDYGVIRDGYVHLEGRRQDLIIRGGENISPIEIENRLFEHPDVAEVAVVGVDHPTLGQEVVAFVVPHSPGALTAHDVKQWVASALAGFKVPSRVELREDLPHNASGKVLKHVLASPEASSGFVEE
jgi:acyl-CoA synthetase (AMP-forming)/AMP-acid ligase II